MDTGERRDHDDVVQHDSPAEARNPFAESPDAESGKPALIETRRSAAIWGVVTGLVFLVLVIAICVAGSIAFS